MWSRSRLGSPQWAFRRGTTAVEIEMPQAQSRVTDDELEREDVRLAALAETGILDTKPEPAFDAITRLAARYFRAENVLLGFADQTRVWIKSYCGQPVQELPRDHSIFEMVLAEDGPLIVPDVARSPELKRSVIALRRLSPASFASVPVRSRDGSILGILTVFTSQTRRFTAPEDMSLLESMADLVTAQIDCAKSAKTAVAAAGAAIVLQSAPILSGQRARISSTLWNRGNSCSITSRKSISPPGASWAWKH